MSKKIIPSIRSFIEDILKEDSSEYFDSDLLETVNTIDRANDSGHTLATQKRLEEIKKLYSTDREKLIFREKYPAQYQTMDDYETEVPCPVCNESMIAKWDYEVDYDMEGPVAAYPDPKCLYCETCKFYVEGNGLSEYLPEGLEDLMREMSEESYEYDFY